MINTLASQISAIAAIGGAILFAWLATAVLTALGSFIQGVLGGLPEVKEKDD